MRARYFLVLLAGVFLLLIVSVVMSVALATAPIDADSTALRIGIGIVLTFLVLLVLRYFALLWLGYLQHIESEVMPDEDAAFTPPVTLIVPAYNEGPVIQPAIRSLLELDYPAY